MRLRNKYFLVLSLVLLVGIWVNADLQSAEEEPLFEVPIGWPQPNYDFSKNPLTPEGVELGRKLFYDPILSRDKTVACSSCHLYFTAFTHVDHALSHGIEDRFGIRNSPALMNLAWGKSFMWDGAINHLDMQALAPISAETEMDEEFPNVIRKLQQHKKYPAWFAAAFGDTAITGERFLKAMSQFELTLISANSKYDSVQRKEPNVAFTPSEKRGYKLFKKNCASCHAEPLFTTGGYANNGLPTDPTLMDAGRMRISQNPADSLKFKIPTLRNIEVSFPYMHDGRFKKLEEILQHYVSGIEASPTLAKELRGGIELSEAEQQDIIAFLLTLTDKHFLYNPKHGFPRF